MVNMLNNLLKVIKNNPIKIIMVGILLLNCFGFCWREFRFLSDQERIEIAVQKALNFYERSGSWGKTDEFINENYGDKGKFDQIPFKNIAEFFSVNPNCCKTSRTAWYPDGIHKVGVFGCLSGFSPYLVSGDFKIRYKVDGKTKVGTSRFVYFISSCGNLSYP